MDRNKGGRDALLLYIAPVEIRVSVERAEQVKGSHWSGVLPDTALSTNFLAKFRIGKALTLRPEELAQTLPLVQATRLLSPSSSADGQASQVPTLFLHVPAFGTPIILAAHPAFLLTGHL